MPKNYLIVCNDDHHFGFPASLAESHGYSWIPDGEVVRGPVEKFADDPRKKIAIVNVFQVNRFKDCSWADMVIGYTSEIVTGTSSPGPASPEKFILDLQKQTRCPNVIVLAGAVLKHWSKHEQVYTPTLTTFDRVCTANQNFELKQPEQRDFLFEALLGRAYAPRRELSKRIQHSNFIDQTLLSISGSHGPEYFYRTPALNQLDHAQMSLTARAELKENGATYFYEDPANNFFGETMLVSVYIPKAVYENSWYSIVSETSPAETSFLTEKTAKALYSQRIFVLFGGYRTLAQLKELGYRTFGDLIDESYDEIWDDRKRWDRAWQTVESLAQLNPQLLYSQAQEILTHNYQLIRNIEHRHRPIQNFISSWLPR
jgi:hypothetical protein